MNESIASRVGRIISGSMNALVDSIENSVPEVVMEEAIREIDGAIDDVRAELGRLVANKHLASNRLTDENSKHNDLAEKIELAISNQRDDLAEAAISRQLDIEAQIPILENTIAEYKEKEITLESYINALQAKKREMEEDLKQFLIAQKEHNGASTTNQTSKNSIHKKSSQATQSFDRVMRNATGVSARVNNGLSKTEAQLSELNDLARKNRIQERLASIKKSN